MSGKFAIVLASFLLALNTVFLKYGLYHLPASHLMLFRFLLASVVFCIFFYKKLSIRGIKRSFILAIFSALSFMFLMWGLKLSLASHVQLILTLIPVFTAIISCIYLKENVKNIQIIGLSVSLAGVLALAFQKDKALVFDDPNSFGLMFILIAALLTSGQIIVSRKISAFVNAYDLAFTTVLGNLIYFFVYSLITPQAFISDIPINAYWAIAYLALGGTVAAFGLYQYGIAKTSAFFAGLSQYIQFPIALLFDAVILHESFTASFLVCALVVYAGTYLASRA